MAKDMHKEQGEGLAKTEDRDLTDEEFRRLVKKLCENRDIDLWSEMSKEFLAQGETGEKKCK